MKSGREFGLPLLKVEVSNPLRECFQALLKDSSDLIWITWAINQAATKNREAKLEELFGSFVETPETLVRFISVACKLNPDPGFHFQLFQRLLFVLTKEGNEHLLRKNNQALIKIIENTDIDFFKQNLINLLQEISGFEGGLLFLNKSALAILSQMPEFTNLQYNITGMECADLCKIFEVDLVVDFVVGSQSEELLHNTEQEKRDIIRRASGLKNKLIPTDKILEVCKSLHAKQDLSRKNTYYPLITQWLKEHMDQLNSGRYDELMIVITDFFNSREIYRSELNAEQTGILNKAISQYQHPISTVLAPELDKLVDYLMRRVNRQSVIPTKPELSEASNVSVWCGLHQASQPAPKETSRSPSVVQSAPVNSFK